MKIPTILLSLSLAAIALATNAAASAQYPSSFNIKSGMASLLVSFDYEQAISANDSLEIGVNVVSPMLGVNAGYKHFFAPGQQEFFMHAQGAYTSDGIGDDRILLGASGGYRFVGNSPFQLEIETGVDAIFSPGSFLGLIPMAGISVGYRF